MDQTEYTILPFFEVLTAAKLFTFFAILVIVAAFIRFIVFKNALTLRKAPTSIIFAYITASIANVLLTTFLYWYWALPLCLVISLIYAYATAAEVRDANAEERMGVWGLNKDIRRIRGELFNDMSQQEQIAYRNKVRETKFSKLVFIAVTMAVALIAIFIFYIADLNYLFFPIPIE